MREALIWIFCLASLGMLTVGKSFEPPRLFRTYDAFEQARERGDWRRAARYGEASLKAAKDHPLIDDEAYLRLMLSVAETQEMAGNPQRAQGLYEAALDLPAAKANTDLLLMAGSGLSRAENAFAGAALRGTAPPDAGLRTQ